MKPENAKAIEFGELVKYQMFKAPKRACKGCWHCIPEYKTKDKSGKRTISKYWCSSMNTTCSDPKECKFREER